MPLKSCTVGGKSGWKWGDSGKCYTGPDAKAKATAQGQAAYASGYTGKRCDVVKVSEELGLVFGFAIVSKIDGEPYFDTQGDHIPEQSMLEAATDFMAGVERTAGDMHKTADGQVVFAFPLTEDIAKSLGIATRMTGLLIAVRPSADVLAKFRSGEYTGFSIGGRRVVDREVND